MPRIGHDPAVERARMEERVRDEGDRRLNLVARPYRDNEQKTWDQQFQEAKELLQNPEAEVDMLPGLAAVRSKDLNAFAREIVEKGRQFRRESMRVLKAQERLLRMDPIPSDFEDESHWTNLGED